jgi:hypothetical protein
MTTGATGQLGLALPVQGELSGTWGDTVNNGLTQYINIAIAGTLTLTNDGAVTLANTTGDASASNITSTLTGAGTVTAQFAIVRVTGTLTTAKVVTAPSYSKTYTVVNAATGGIVTFKASGQTGVSVAVGETAFVYFNGTDYVKVAGTAAVSSFSAGTTGLTPNTATTGAVTLAGTLATTNGGTGLTSFTSGGVVYASSSSALATGSALQFNGTNLGLGVTPTAWYTADGTTRAIQVSTSGAVVANDNAMRIMQNAYFNTSGAATYLLTGFASQYLQNNSAHSWSTAPSGTAGNPITFTQAMTLDASGNLGLGSTTTAGGRLVITQSNATQPAIYLPSNESTIQGPLTNTKILMGGNLVLNGNSLVALNAVDGSAYMTFATANTERMRLNSSGNLGLGTTPSAWAGLTVFEFGLKGGLASSGADINLIYNSYYDGGNSIYRTSDFASYYQQGAGQHRFYTAPSGTAGAIVPYTQVMTLTNAGNLAIGTTSAATRLHVSASAPNIEVATRTENTDSGTASLAAFQMKTGTSSNVFQMFTRNNLLQWGIAGISDLMALNSSGNLGIGTSSPAYQLTVGTAGTTADSYIQLASTTTGTGNLFFGDTAGTGAGSYRGYIQYSHNVDAFIFASAGAEAARIDNGGNLLVGTTSNLAYINGSVQANFRTIITKDNTSTSHDSTIAQLAIDNFNTTAGNYSQLAFTTSDGVNRVVTAGIYAQITARSGAGWTTSNLQFHTGTVGGQPTEKMRLTNDGNLLIGVNAPTLSTNTFFTTGGASQPCLYLLKNSASNTDQAFCVANGVGGGTVSFQVLASGNAQNTNNSYGAISDVKLKENIVDATPKLADLMQVKVRHYNFKSDETKAKQIGVVAQELEQVFPSMIEQTVDCDLQGNDLGTKTKAVKYSVFVPMLIKAIQEQQAIIESLKARLDAANL